MTAKNKAVRNIFCSLAIYLGSISFLANLVAQTPIIDFASEWRYYDGGNQPPSQTSSEWMENSYSDNIWKSGNAQIGFGDGDEVTSINSTILTGYFRKVFTILDPAVIENLKLQLIYDDGAVVYLNGQEIWRMNMPAGAISYTTLAATGSSDNATASQTVSLQLLQGENLIAVEVHQRAATSSDMSFDFSCLAIPSLQVIRGPYLQSSTDHSMVVKWRTSEPVISKIKFGVDVNQLGQANIDLVPKINHEVVIDNLDPSTKYFYQIEDESQALVAASVDLFLVTAPLPGSRVPLSAWILGDCGTANTNARSVRDAYHAYTAGAQTDMILFLGDNAYQTGTDNEYQSALFENMYENTLKNTVSWSCLGNHDGGSASSGTQTGPYYDIFTFPTQGECGGIASGTEAYYSFDYGNIHFIVLDSYDSDRSVGGYMHMWCEQDLQNTMSDWIVALWHHPAYSKGSHDSDSESAQIQMRENFLPLLESYGVDLVLSGHSHSYERSYFLNGHYGNSDSFNALSHLVGTNGGGDGRANGDGAYTKAISQDEGAVYITAGSSGQKSGGLLDHEAMYLSVSELGSCVLEVFGDKLKVKFIRETGIAQDSFSIDKDLGCTPNSPCDDGDICTTNDHLNTDCQCIGTPISNAPVNLVLDQTDAPLHETYLATQMIEVMGSVSTSSGQLTTLIAPSVLLHPAFSVPIQSTLVIHQSGCTD